MQLGATRFGTDPADLALTYGILYIYVIHNITHNLSVNLNLLELGAKQSQSSFEEFN